MRLLIVESPSKAKTIEKYLGKDFRVVASVGHIRDLPKSNKSAIDIPAGFVPHYEVVKGKEKINSEIKPKTKRIVFNEITKEAVEEALEHPREIDTNLREAQEARRVLDRLVGYDLSGLVWKKVRYGLSAGRVQSPALRIIMEREREIRAFKPVTFWSITARLEDGSKNDLVFFCSKEPTDKEEVEKILEVAKENLWKVIDIKETEVARVARAPFITSTLQQT